jgi:alcohol dehydrogenase class IV
MVKPFQFARLPQIYFGKGKIAELPGILKKFGNSVILVTGRQSFLNSLAAKTLFQKLENSGIDYQHVSVPAEPSPGMIDQTVSKFRDQSVSAVVGIGGGSVLDAGKAISAMLNLNEPVMDYLEGVGNKEHPGTKVPYIALPTTSGTGSEATKNAVLSETGENGFKRSLRHDNFVPDVAIVDPELTLNCPQHITSASGMDCFTQLTESYLSTKATPYTDALAFEGLKAIKYSLERSFIHGEELEARTGMAFAALTSGICLANAGLGVVHGFASSLGGMYDIPHGVICGTLMAKSNDINVRELRKQSGNSEALKKYAALGKLFLEKENQTEEYYIDSFIFYLHELTDKLHLPGLMLYGIKDGDLEKACNSTETKNNPVKLSVEDLKEILSGRFL